MIFRRRFLALVVLLVAACLTAVAAGSLPENFKKYA